MPSIEDRLDKIEAILAGLAELSQAGYRKERPEKISADALTALRLQQAAHARAAKPVGTGQGRVKTSATKRRLAKNAKRFK